MADIRELTTNYVTAFNARDLDGVAKHLAEGFELTDPEVTAIKPKNKVLEYIKGLFDAHKTMSFEANSIYVDGDASVIHFTLDLGTTVLDGVDIIKWKHGRMISMHAYLNQRSTLD